MCGDVRPRLSYGMGCASLVVFQKFSPCPKVSRADGNPDHLAVGSRPFVPARQRPDVASVLRFPLRYAACGSASSCDVT